MSMDASYDVIVIGGGQAGLAAGYYLKQCGKRFVILDENKRSGDVWRSRWDSLRLFTPVKYNSLPGMPFPGGDFYFPSKDEAADYLEAYAARLALPVQRGVRVERLGRVDAGYRIDAGGAQFTAPNVIVATGAYQQAHTPAFAAGLGPQVFQLHSSAYCNPGQIPADEVWVVGAGNSGAEIAIELARAGKNVRLAGRDVGRIPADRLGRALGGRPYWFFISRVLSVSTPMGRKMHAAVLAHGAPLIGASRAEVERAGVELTPRVAQAHPGALTLEDGRRLPVEAVIWATGFRPAYTWVNLPIFNATGWPRHTRGVVADAPGLYFVGLPFQTALSSALLGGVGADATEVVRRLR